MKASTLGLHFGRYQSIRPLGLSGMRKSLLCKAIVPVFRLLTPDDSNISMTANEGLEYFVPWSLAWVLYLVSRRATPQGSLEIWVSRLSSATVHIVAIRIIDLFSFTLESGRWGARYSFLRGWLSRLLLLHWVEADFEFDHACDFPQFSDSMHGRVFVEVILDFE